MTYDKRRAERLVMELMAIEGKSGQEAEVSRYIRQRLVDGGADTGRIKSDSSYKKATHKSGTGNLIFRLPGTMRGPRRLLTAHMDTVPICVGCRPRKKKNLVVSAIATTGLGADDRAGCATTLNAALNILERDLPHPPLTFCWFIQEEIGLHGARNVPLSLLGNPKLAFNWDGGSATKLTIGATGGYRMEIEVTGIASHAGGAPEWGVSAVAIAATAIADLQANGWHGDIRKGKQHGTSNFGMIQGGEATNVVTDRVRMNAEARSHNPKFRERIVKEIDKAFQRAQKQVRNIAKAQGSYRIDGRLDYEAFRLSADEPCVLAAEQAARQLGHEPNRVVANGGLDANWLSARGIPTVSMGAGQLNQHMVSEALDLDQFHVACQMALTLATASESAA